MGAVDLDAVSWPDVKAGIEAGRDRVVMALGAFKQHGLHLPLETDVLGDHLARVIADRLDEEAPAAGAESARRCRCGPRRRRYGGGTPVV